MEENSHPSPMHLSSEPYNLNEGRVNTRIKPHQRSNLEFRSTKKMTRSVVSNFKEFSTNTSLHGFRYIMDDKYSFLERIWWTIMVTCSILACAFFIKMVWTKWDETPVIVSFADTSNSVWHIPFPAVTICTETKPRQTLFNFTKVYTDRWEDPSAVSPEDQKTYEDMLLVCNYAPHEGPEYVNASSIETLMRLAPTMDEMFIGCFWDNLTCSRMFSHTLTKDGVCFTFNMLSEQQLFRTEKYFDNLSTNSLHKDYTHVGGKNYSRWSLEKGYPSNASVHTYPWRGPSYGGEDFEAILLTDMRDIDHVCRGPVQGFKVWLHNPAELPNMGQNFFRIPIQQQCTAAIYPEVMDTSEGLRNYSPHKRQCYFPNERYLRFFRTYTQRNCELECASNHTALRCDCVPFYMPHGPETKVCGGSKYSCVRKSLEELSLSRSSLRSSENTIHECDCLQACLELKYDFEVSQAVYDLTRFKQNPDSDIGRGERTPSGLVMYFSEDLFTSLRRSELYGHVDFLANCGGIMGLFIGFSFLSLIEIIYYFTMRVWCYLRKSSVVEDNS